MLDVRARRRQSGQASIWAAGVLLVIAAYLILTFLPPWYKSWKAKNLMGEAVAGVTTDGLSEEALKTTIVGRLNKIGVDIAESDVELEINKETRFIKVNVDWKARVKYPFTKKYTTINFYLKVRRKSG